MGWFSAKSCAPCLHLVLSHSYPLGFSSGGNTRKSRFPSGRNRLRVAAIGNWIFGKEFEEGGGILLLLLGHVVARVR